MQTSISKSARQDPLEFLKQEAEAHGFDAVGVTSPEGLGEAGARLRDFVAIGRHGEMAWMESELERRADPRVLWPDVKSVVMFAMNYGPAADPLENLRHESSASISVYAQNRDYHQLIKGRLKTIAGRLKRLTGAEVKVFVDTAPVMEKPLAAAAGLGWQGKHTNLVSREKGSWLFLGSIFSAAEIPISEPEPDNCGSCRACLDICPTKAFPAPYQLDARRCISYLTIEHEGSIPHEFRAAVGNRIYGCDDCLAVCPWNKFAETAREAKLQARDDLKSPPLAFLLSLDDPAFRSFFSGSAIKRIGQERFIRNVLIAAGNSGDAALIEQVAVFLSDASPLLRGAAVWAFSRLATCGEFAEEAAARMSAERDQAVFEEWVLGGTGG
jgi:epoxyqueuosine reductase